MGGHGRGEKGGAPKLGYWVTTRRRRCRRWRRRWRRWMWMWVTRRGRRSAASRPARGPVGRGVNARRRPRPPSRGHAHRLAARDQKSTTLPAPRPTTVTADTLVWTARAATGDTPTASHQTPYARRPTGEQQQHAGPIAVPPSRH